MPKFAHSKPYEIGELIDAEYYNGFFAQVFEPWAQKKNLSRHEFGKKQVHPPASLARLFSTIDTVTEQELRLRQIPELCRRV